MSTPSLSAVFHSRDLTGDFLVVPVRSYHQFFAEKIEVNSGLAKVALVVVNIVTGIIVYPVLGIFALIGMLIKSRGVEGLRTHNQERITEVRGEQTGMSVSEEGYISSSSSSENRQRHSYKTFIVTPQNYQETFSQITAAIEDCNQRLIKVYTEFRGNINIRKNTGALDVRLFTNAPQVYVEPVAKPAK